MFVCFFCRTVTVRLAGPWHGCPPFPLHSRAMVTCSGWFLYSRGRLSSNSCSVATCWASRATAILNTKNESLLFQTHLNVVATDFIGCLITVASCTLPVPLGC